MRRGPLRRCVAVASRPPAGRAREGAGLRRAPPPLRPRPRSTPARLAPPPRLGRPAPSPRPPRPPRRPCSFSRRPLASRPALAAESGRKSCWWAAVGLRTSGVPGSLRPGRRGGPAVHASAAAARSRDGFQSEQPVRLHGGPAGAHHHREAGPPEPQGAPRGGGTARRAPGGLPLPRPPPLRSPRRPGTLLESSWPPQSSFSPRSPCYPNMAPLGSPSSTPPGLPQPGPPDPEGRAPGARPRPLGRPRFSNSPGPAGPGPFPQPVPLGTAGRAPDIRTSPAPSLSYSQGPSVAAPLPASLR